MNNNPEMIIDYERFAISLFASLSNAQTLLDVRNIFESCLNFFQLKSLTIYSFDKNKDFYYLSFLNDTLDVENDQRPLKIFPQTNLFDEIMASNAKRFKLFESENIFPKNSFFAPVVCLNKKIGVVIIEAGNEKYLQKHRKTLLHIAAASIQTIFKIRSKDRQKQLTSITHQLFENSSESFSRWSASSGWTFLNPHLLHRVGYNSMNLKIDNVFGNSQVMTDPEWKKCQQALNECFTKGKNCTIEYSVVSPNNEPHIFQTKLIVQQKTSAGKVSEITGISTNITKSKTPTKQAIANLEMDTWLLHLNTKIFNECTRESIKYSLHEIGEHLNFDRAYVRLYGKDKNALVFAEWSKDNVSPISAIAPSVYNPNPADASTLTFEDISTANLSDEIRPKYAEVNVIAQLIEPLFNSGKFIGYLVLQSVSPKTFPPLLRRAAKIIADAFSMVLVKEKILEKLTLSSQRFQLAMEAASYGLWEINLTKKTIYISPNYYLMLGLSPEDKSGFNPIDTRNIHVDDREKSLRYINSLASGEAESFSYESRYIKVNGEVIWVLARGKVIKWDDLGTPILATGTLTNITHLKKHQMDLQLAYQEAQSSGLAKSEFLARMSHEIRTPMNAIIGMSYLTLQTKLSEEQFNYISDIDSAAKSLLQIIDDILDFSKIEAGKLVIDIHPFNFLKHMERLSDRYTPIAANKNLTFTLNMGSDVPEFIEADSTRLRQILDNLIGNSIKFTSAGEIILDVKCIQKPNKDLMLSFLVSDTGIGLNPDQLDTLFEPFNQADGSSTRQFGGTGLGLAISRNLVELMNGTIRATGEHGKGSQFQFTIPCRLVEKNLFQLPSTTNSENLLSDFSSRHEAYNAETETAVNPLAAASSKTLAHSEFIDLHGKHVLLVEDNKVNQKVASGTLKHQKMHVTIANNGTEAVYMMKASSSHSFDFVLMDIEMPYMGGLEATEAIRRLERHANVPIIAMTANIIGDNKSRYLDAGMNDCISKPIAPSELYRVLQQQLFLPKQQINHS